MGIVLARQVSVKLWEKCEGAPSDFDDVWNDEEFMALATDGLSALLQNKVFTPLVNDCFRKLANTNAHGRAGESASSSTIQPCDSTNSWNESPDNPKKRADKPKKRVDNSKKRADNSKKRADDSKKRADNSKKCEDEIRSLAEQCIKDPVLFFPQQDIKGVAREDYAYSLYSYIEKSDKDPSQDYEKTKTRSTNLGNAGKRYNQYTEAFRDSGILFVLPTYENLSFYEKRPLNRSFDKHIQKIQSTLASENGLVSVSDSGLLSLDIFRKAGELLTSIGKDRAKEFAANTTFVCGGTQPAGRSSLKRKRGCQSANRREGNQSDATGMVQVPSPSGVSLTVFSSDCLGTSLLDNNTAAYAGSSDTRETACTAQRPLSPLVSDQWQTAWPLAPAEETYVGINDWDMDTANFDLWNIYNAGGAALLV
ncbi:hypothetical protein BKA67DRAFT_663213 [Truncatella angustata]|uniref:Uncharacterized protein n=1 Tax=Truncatella angustata TaxID=152316 RepID=A0A9P8RIU5_9PEZI|nr:uncharacterized protein BKA67DRAFT_663213 [Truncatella angustata]KAH6646839.1 hypothetical protein BKA67DRAFT_663213 [Truncatella angustata]